MTAGQLPTLAIDPPRNGMLPGRLAPTGRYTGKLSDLSAGWGPLAVLTPGTLLVLSTLAAHSGETPLAPTPTPTAPPAGFTTNAAVQFDGAAPPLPASDRGILVPQPPAGLTVPAGVLEMRPDAPPVIPRGPDGVLLVGERLTVPASALTDPGGPAEDENPLVYGSDAFERYFARWTDGYNRMTMDELLVSGPQIDREGHLPPGELTWRDVWGWLKQWKAKGGWE